MSLIPLPYRIIAIALAVAALSAGLWGFIHHQRTLGKAEEVAAQTQRALTASIANQAVTAQRVTDIQEKAHVADLAASAARADAVAARSAGERLQQRFAALSRAGATHPAASGASAPASGADDLSADVFRSVREMAGQYAAIADQSRIAGQACEQSYGTLIAPAKP